MVSIFRVDLSNLCTNVSYFWADLQMQATLEKASIDHIATEHRKTLFFVSNEWY